MLVDANGCPTGGTGGSMKPQKPYRVSDESAPVAGDRAPDAPGLNVDLVKVGFFDAT
jgi:hypothetical protein